jgi:uncharacterized membrane protein
METTKQTNLLGIAGAAFLILAGFFLWRDLSLPRELVMTVLALVTGMATALRWPRRWPAVAPVALICTTLAAVIWFTLEKQVSMLPSLAIALVTGGAAVLRGQHAGEGKLADQVIWYAFGTALLALTWGLYFNFLTAGFASDWVARRLIITVFWLALGLLFFVRGTGRLPAAVHVGLGFIGVAVAKAAFYDTSHLHGYLRIGALAAVGLLLVVGAWVMGGEQKPAGAGGEQV